jgi:tetratricopeptide (TPR) repeat protein
MHHDRMTANPQHDPSEPIPTADSGEEGMEHWEEIDAGHRLVAPPPDLPPPLTVTSPLLLQVEQLSWEGLEHLIVALAREVEGAVRSRLYGRNGQKQHGIDVVGYFDDGSLTVYQAKRRQSFTADALSDAVRMYVEGTRPFDATRFVLVTTAYAGDTAVEDRLHQLRKDYHPLDIELWGRQQLSDLLFPQRALVERFFGRATAEVFCADGPEPATEHTHTVVGSPIRDFTDPFALEVHRVIDAEARDPGDRLPPLPAYISREHDMRVGRLVARATAEQSALAVLVGDSSTGKTRACWEAVQALPDDWRLWYPIAPSPAEALLNGVLSVKPRTVVWLDEIESYLASPQLGEQVAAALRELLKDPTRGPVVVLGTAWPEHWERLTLPPASGAPDRHREARMLLAGHSVLVPRSFDEPALLEARRAAHEDRRLAEALHRVGDGRIVQYLSAAFALMERYTTAPAPAQAVIHAAMDARRIGCSGALPRTLLELAAVGYLTDEQWSALREGWFDRTLSALQQPCRGATSPLSLVRPRPGQAVHAEPHFRLADYLDHHGRSSRATGPAAASLWSALPDHAAVNDLVGLAWEARNRGLFRYSFQLHLSADAAGIEGTAWLAGDLMERAEQHQEALRWYQRAVESRDEDAYANLVELSEALGQKDEAVDQLTRLAEAKDELALSWVVELTANSRSTDETISWLGGLADRGDAAAAREAGEKLQQHGRLAEALEFYRRAALSGDALAIRQSVGMVWNADGPDRALAWLNELAQGGATDLMVTANTLAQAGRSVEALSFFKRAADAGHDMAFGVGAELAVKCEGLEQAATWLEPFATAGRPFASAAYLEVLMEAERSDDALRWCLEPERRVDMAVLHTAAELLVASGREDEALRWLGSLAEQGHAFALWRMAGLFEQLGRVDEAVSCAKKLAKQGNTSALHLTAFLTTRHANGEEAISLYRKAILAGEPFAIAEMVDLLKELGCHDEADRLRKYGLEADGQIAGGAG